jgi:hypothetical protein
VRVGEVGAVEVGHQLVRMANQLTSRISSRPRTRGLRVNVIILFVDGDKGLSRACRNQHSLAVGGSLPKAEGRPHHHMGIRPSNLEPDHGLA